MVLKPRRQLWVPCKPAIIVPRRRPLPVVRPPIIPARRFVPMRASVGVDATGTEIKIASGTSLSYSGHWTIGSGLSNSAAIVVLVYSAAVTGTAITFSSPQLNSTSCPQIINESAGTSNLGQAGVALFGQIAPASGPATFTVTASQAVDACTYGVSFTGVNQTGGATSFPNSVGHNDGGVGATNVANTITTANGNYTICAAAMGNASAVLQLASVTTQDWSDSTDQQGNVCAAGKAASTTTTATWNAHNPLADLAVIAGTDILAAAATATIEEDNSWPPRRYWSGWMPNANLLKNTAQDTSSNAVETNPHWRPWTLPPQWLLNRNLVRHRAQDESSNAAETNIHFIPRAFPPQWMPTARLIIHRAQDESSNAAETNIHTVFKTWPVQWTPLSLLRAVPNDAPLPVQAETNTFFIPRTYPPQWQPQASLKQNTAQDFSSNAAETNPHWLGKTWPVQWVTFLLTHAPATDAPVPAQPETNTFFIPRTYPPQWVLQGSLRQNTAQDLSSLGTATNTFFIPRTWPAQWNLQASLMRGTAQDFSTTPPPFVEIYENMFFMGMGRVGSIGRNP